MADAPVTIGLASLLDAARRMAPARLRALAALAAAAVIGATLLAVVAGGTRDRYIANPARLGEALEQVAATPEARRAELAWTGPGLRAPRWASYYLDVPVWDLEESRLPELADSDLVIVRASRTPDFFPADALEDPPGRCWRLPGDHGRVAVEMTAPPPAAVRGNDWRSLAVAPSEFFKPEMPATVVVPYYQAPEALALTLAATGGPDLPAGAVRGGGGG